VRSAWAKKTLSNLQPEGTLLTCIFPICDKEGGPPFAMSVPLVRSILEPEGWVSAYGASGHLFCPSLTVSYGLPGFQAAEIREDAAKHTAGGFAASTALGRWTVKVGVEHVRII